MTYQRLRVCFFGTYRANYTRNQILLEQLESAGIDVIICHKQLWRNGQERVSAASGKWLNLEFIWRVLRVYLELIVRYLQIQDHDIVLVGYPGLFDVFIARLLSWVRHKPLVWDILLSPFLIAKERQLDNISPATVSGLQRIERFACQLPDLMLLETDAFIAWFSTNYNISRSRFRLSPLGAPKDFYRNKIVHNISDQFTILFYGSFLPSHGVNYIIEAARLLCGEKHIHFELIGDGPESEKMKIRSKEYNLNNTTFIRWMEKDDLIEKINRADICLGAFGKTTHSMMSIQFKIYECMALGKPIITGDSPTTRKQFTHGKNIIFVERADSEALATSIMDLVNNNQLRQSIANNAYITFNDNYSTEQLGLQLKQSLVETINTTDTKE